MTIRTAARRTAGTLALSAALVALSAATAQAADAVVFEPTPEPVTVVPQRSILLGIGAAVAPVYEGADDYRVAPFPIFSYDSGVDGPRRFEFRALDDIRFHALRLGGFSAGPLGGYRFGRDEDDADLLEGIGDIDGGVVGGAFVAYDVEVAPNAFIGADVGISTQFTGDPFDEDVVGDDFDDDDYGFLVDFGVSASFDLTRRANLALRAGAEYASDDYMDVHFGINAAQAAASVAGLDEFDPDSGIKNVYVNANVAFDVTERFQVRAGAGYSRLVGDAADSPVTIDDNQFSGSLGAAYRFKF